MFISFAQNFEDVILWRALNHVENGFYIDIGAAWPDNDSVTKLFYDRGWRGINIEPNKKLYSKLEQSRGRDINLNLAIAEYEGVLPLYVFRDTGLSTLDCKVAEMHQDSGRSVVCVDIRVCSLADLWASYVPEGQPVHFLKIDVEGSEAPVLRGNDWRRYRPWVLVIEATVPSSRVESHDSWEYLLVDAEYFFVYADGLNRFYLAKERSDLLDAFKLPPNVFDNFRTRSHDESELHLKELKEKFQHTKVLLIEASQRETTLRMKIDEFSISLSVAREACAKLDRQLDSANRHIAALTASTSWRLTAPIRGLAILLRGSIFTWPRKIARHGLLRIGDSIIRRPKLKRAAISLLNRLPVIKRFLLGRIFAGRYSPAVGINQVGAIRHPLDYLELNPRARVIYMDLMSKIRKRV
jgi:FkbM family methyltransferase